MSEDLLNAYRREALQDAWQLSASEQARRAANPYRGDAHSPDACPEHDLSGACEVHHPVSVEPDKSDDCRDFGELDRERTLLRAVVDAQRAWDTRKGTVVEGYAAWQVLQVALDALAEHDRAAGRKP